ncbi:hypothetical protein SSABA_v1c05490 [Spiroplasma sabaudiense Ar-1343]|uniref:Transmembrane protein n=1 Tax=Spiroplasma sabaudiense Ar-1343 TaxID=1276257 RepID=W6A9U9_9MOLU|nr:hypothetical protein [Spiroplasma sabaudiense]AHI53953.1 hypothetical protein SSABA_v1c05490 [Spiroplasma sabaudiense Ar-1343]
MKKSNNLSKKLDNLTNESKVVNPEPELSLEEKFERTLNRSVSSFYNETVKLGKSKWSVKLIYYGMSLIALAFLYLYITSILYREIAEIFVDVKNGFALRILMIYILPFVIFLIGSSLAILSFFKRKSHEDETEYFEDWEYLYDLYAKINVDKNLELLSFSDDIFIINGEASAAEIIGTDDFKIHKALNFQRNRQIISYADIYFNNSKTDYNFLKFFGIELFDKKQWFDYEITLEITQELKSAFLENKIEDYLFFNTGLRSDILEEAEQVHKIVEVLKFSKWLKKFNLQLFDEFVISIMQNKIFFGYNFRVEEKILNRQNLDYILKEQLKVTFKNKLISKIGFELENFRTLTLLAYKIINPITK